MSLPATDTFTGTNGTALTTYSSNWTLNDGGLFIDSNALYPNHATNECFAGWNADAFNDDQYAQIKIVAVANGVFMGPAVRVSTAGTSNGYELYSDVDTDYLAKVVGGVWTQIGSSGGGAATNDVMRLEVSGTTLTPKRNGTTIAAIGAQTDAAFSSGRAGICGYATNQATLADDWEGGNLGGTPSVYSRFAFEGRPAPFKSGIAR